MGVQAEGVCRQLLSEVVSLVPYLREVGVLPAQVRHQAAQVPHHLLITAAHLPQSNTTDCHISGLQVCLPAALSPLMLPDLGDYLGGTASQLLGKY